MLASAAAVLLAAAPQLKLAVLDANTVGFAAEARSFYTQQVGLELGLAGAEATTPQQIAAVLGLERQKALAGCDQDSSDCLVELANALGVDGIAMTNVAKVGAVFQLTLRVIDAARGQAVGTFSRQAAREEDLLGAIAEGAKLVARDAAAALKRSLKLEVSPQGGGARKLAWIPAVGGVAFAAGGVALLVGAGLNHDALNATRSAPMDLASAQKLRDEGALMQALGAVGIGVGGAALVAAGAMLIFGGPSPSTPQLSVAPVEGGAALMVRGVLP
jgi:hypothetical protein